MYEGKDNRLPEGVKQSSPRATKSWEKDIQWKDYGAAITVY